VYLILIFFISCYYLFEAIIDVDSYGASYLGYCKHFSVKSECYRESYAELKPFFLCRGQFGVADSGLFNTWSLFEPLFESAA